LTQHFVLEFQTSRFTGGSEFTSCESLLQQKRRSGAIGDWRWAALSVGTESLHQQRHETSGDSRGCYNSGSRFQVKAGALKSGGSNNIPDTRPLARPKKESGNPISTGSN
jgi:hypothetical protein